MTRTVILVCGLAAAAPALASAQDRQQQQLISEIRITQEQIQQLRLVVNTLAEALTALNKTTTAKLDEQANSTRKGFADSKLTIDAIADNGRVLREKVDNTDVRISKIGQDVQLLQKSVSALQNVVAPLAALIPTTTPDGQQPPGVGAPPSSAAAGGSGAMPPDRTYDMAYSDYLRGNYDIAIAGFGAFLRSCPTCANAADAQFYIGESQFAQSKFQDAVASYGLVISDFKGSAREPDAYYHRGLAYENLSPAQKDKAAADFQYIIKNFPDSNLKPMAQAGLLRVRK
jgi:TolA-binding protein